MHVKGALSWECANANACIHVVVLDVAIFNLLRVVDGRKTANCGFPGSIYTRVIIRNKCCEQEINCANVGENVTL